MAGEINLRHAVPQFLIDYRNRIKEVAPKCCHTCHHYTTDGRCIIFLGMVPEDFASKIDACTSYEEEIPF